MDKSKKTIKSSALKCGRKTFFFDVNLASNNKKYLKVTESRFIGEGSETKRSSFVIFPEELVNFQSRLAELATELA